MTTCLLSRQKKRKKKETTCLVLQLAKYSSLLLLKTTRVQAEEVKIPITVHLEPFTIATAEQANVTDDLTFQSTPWIGEWIPQRQQRNSPLSPSACSWGMQRLQTPKANSEFLHFHFLFNRRRRKHLAIGSAEWRRNTSRPPARQDDDRRGAYLHCSLAALWAFKCSMFW